jgi:hypothetical protein
MYRLKTPCYEMFRATIYIYSHQPPQLVFGWILLNKKAG